MFNISLSKGAALRLLCIVDAQLELAHQQLAEAEASGDQWAIFDAQDNLDHLAEARAALSAVEEDYTVFIDG